MQDGYRYNGENFMTWATWLDTATRKYPILSNLLKGKAMRPTGDKIKESYDHARLTQSFIAGEQAFSPSVNVIHYDTTSAYYGTDTNGGAHIPEWTNSDILYELEDARREYDEEVAKLRASYEEQNPGEDVPDFVPPGFEVWLPITLNPRIEAECEAVINARQSEYDAADGRLLQLILDSIRPDVDLKHIRSCKSGTEAYRLLVAVFSGSNGTRSGLLANFRSKTH